MSEKVAPKLIHVTRLDSYPALKATFTEEGYLKDKPILTSTGIFEYKNADGSIRRELRLPEDVFDPESLASYKGKPIVITHDAGLITSDNVAENQIGTILTDGEKDGNDVRAEIMIHDTDELRRCRFKELSLGYNLDLEETPGEYNGQPYDAIQRNIRVNHLAVVREARAGDQARLNIDSRADKTILIGGHKAMAKRRAVRADGILSPEELQKAIAEYKARRAASKTDEDDKAKAKTLAKQEVVKPFEETTTVAEKTVAPVEPKPVEEKPVQPIKKDEEPKDEPETIELPDQKKPLEEKLDAVKARRDLRDEKGDPEDVDGAMEQIAEQDEDIDYLYDIIDTLLAERDFGKHEDEGNDTIPAIDPDNELHEENEEEAPEKTEDLEKEDACGTKKDSAEERIPDTTKAEVEADVDEEKLAKETEFGFDSDDEFVFEDEEEEFEEDEDIEEDEDVAQHPDRPIPDAEAEDEDDVVEEEEFVEDCGDKPFNADAIDAIVQRQLRERLKIARIGKMVNMDGLEYQPIKAAKRKIIRAVRPGVRLDGKSDTYVNAMFDLAVDDIKKRNAKDTAYQKRQMFNKKFNGDSKSPVEEDSAEARRQKMIERQENRKQK